MINLLIFGQHIIIPDQYLNLSALLVSDE